MDLQIEEFDSKIREIIPEKATLEQVATGFGFTKGPIWCGDYLLFSDISRSRIVRLQMHSYGPEITTFRTLSGNSNGLTLDRSGRLIACEHSTRRVTCTELDGSVWVLADSYDGGPLNSPNDVVVRYFTVSDAATIGTISAYIDSFLSDVSINNEGTAQSLNVFLERAQANIERGNIKAAENLLNPFIHFVEAQSGKHITAEAAQTLIDSAQEVIDSL